MADDKIILKGVRVNNLQNIDLEIPRGKLVVITGISGSGKSSLAFDTLFAEGQRRFAESLSSYARQFLGRMSKPDVDLIEGIPPAIAIEQRVNIRNPRSTIATTTEIYDYLRMIYARIGKTISPVSGVEVKCHNASDVLRYIFDTDGSAPATAAGEGIAYILVDLGWGQRSDKVELMLSLKEEGFTRFLVDEKPERIESQMQKAADGDFSEEAYLLVDRFRTDCSREGLEWDDTKARALSSIETAFAKGNGRLLIWKDGVVSEFSERFEADGIVFRKPDEYLFSFNSPLGACPVCGGLGRIEGISEDLIVPDKSKSIYDGAIVCWRGEKMGWFKDQLIANAERNGIPIFEPWCNLSEEVRTKIWKGCPAEDEKHCIVGLEEFFEWVRKNRYKIQYRYLLSRYTGKTTCHSCGGSRLRKEAGYVKVGGKTISELMAMDVGKLIPFFENIELSESDRNIAGKAIDEVLTRLRYISDVGLSYLTLNRSSNSLSGGESQRINLVTALGSSLVGSMYILDEPSIGLHPRDTERLISVLKRLRDLGNTIVVVEHDEEIMRAADLLIDMGPKAGSEGGRVVFCGRLGDGAGSGKVAGPGKVVAPGNDLAAEKVVAAENSLAPESGAPSLTLQYLRGERPRYSRSKRTPNYFIKVEGAMEHNLKDIDVAFPLNTLTVVTGVSGSGKSSLVGDILYRAMFRHLNETGEAPGTFRALSGSLDRISQVEYVDQNPIGRSSRSNAVTYLKIYDDIRKLLSEQPYAKMNGYGPAHFSFNQEGGRCPECQGDGFVRIGMQFMADVTMTCEACGGKRFKPDILEVRYRGCNVDDILNMSVSEAIDFFSTDDNPYAQRITARLKTLVDVGLSYIKLGQSSSTLSGGESQRIKLAYYLSMTQNRDSVRPERILFIFDEPTTGLHFYDVEKLLRSFDVLLSKGHSIVVVEHNPDVIRAADWVLDLGPDAGDNGGELVFAGTPEELVAQGNTFTAKYL
ncbi:MAG: excinuclease ABC subunit UvrA [Candidatus Cryptobacteroides sp.]|nr:excinuclease ABC subunit UvrA [Bacteroidales bacterium]MDY5744019.1 excinuclease ABC subunit UvrA [Candidatus Cryptobacteroides sp.]